MNIICRNSVINKLQSYYEPDQQEYEVQYPPVLFVYGNQSTGKTLVIKKFFGNSRIPHTFINCQEYNTSRGLLEAIINRSEFLHSPQNDEDYIKIDSNYAFMDHLMNVDARKSFVIVLDNADNLRNIDVNLMRMFFNLQQLTSLNISLVLISQLPFEKFHSKSGDIRPNIIHFPSYTKEEIVQILTADFKLATKVDARATEDYIQIILNVFFKACKDLTELKFVCRKFWTPYWQPVLDGTIAEHETQKLWKNISKILRTGLAGLYQRTIDDPNKTETRIKVVDLPYYTKGLLVAAFLASYNPLKNDKRLFVKHHGKQTKRLQTVNKNAVNFDKATLTLGPKTFTVDRLLAIFCAILDEKVGITTNLISQISTLVNLKYLSYISGENNVIDGAGRLQCNITQEKASQLSSNIGIDFKKYISAF
ncbi:origin recognition complex subunit 5 [Culicoides brevitarsis]|uniref:origin recognition complex subunit 5 n=1 Tax=Culicoides brevitarsis TaxID=469753 RepID=UPI00307C8182